MGACYWSGLCGVPQGGPDAPDDGRHREGVGSQEIVRAVRHARQMAWPVFSRKSTLTSRTANVRFGSKADIFGMSDQFPLYPQKQTLVSGVATLSGSELVADPACRNLRIYLQ